MTSWHQRMRVGGYEGHTKANEISVTHPLYMKRAYGEKPTYGEKSIWRKNSSVLLAKTDLTLEAQKLGDCKSCRRKKGTRMSNTAFQSILHSFRQTQALFCSEQRNWRGYIGAHDFAEFLGQHEKAGYLSGVVVLCQMKQMVFYTAILSGTSFTLRKEPMQQLFTKCLQACRNPQISLH